MKYIITEEQSLRLYKIMKNLMLERLPHLESPLVKKTIPSIDSRSGIVDLDDFNKKTTLYKDADGEPWFKEFDDKDRFEESKWEVNEGLDFLFDVFGEDLFMDFVKHYFKINLREKGNKNWDWVFR
jgi:hypothetical protein